MLRVAMMRVVLVALGAVLPACAGCDPGFPNPPAQPRTGPGGSEYRHASVTKSTLEEYRRDEITAEIYAAPSGYKREQGFGQ